MEQNSKLAIGFFVLQILLLALLAPIAMAMAEPGCFDCDAGPEFSPFTALLAVIGTALVAFMVRKRIIQKSHN